MNGNIFSAMRTAIAAIFVFLFSAGSSAREFPVGLFGIKTASELRIIKSAGFDCFQTYDKDPATLAALAAEAKKLKMKILAYPEQIIGSEMERSASSWPMLAWYIYDEPEIHNILPDDAHKTDVLVKKSFPKHNTALVVGDGLASFSYAGAADFLMVDWYPIPHLAPESVGYHVNLAAEAGRQAGPRGKSVWAVLQAFDWINYPQRSAVRVGGFPSFDQIRFMTWLALARGAGGVFYFTFSTKDGKNLAEFPQYWSRVSAMGGELSRFRPVLENGKEIPVPIEINEPIAAKAWRYRMKKYLLLVNTSPENSPLLLAKLRGWRPLFEKTRALDGIVGAEGMAPYRVLLLEK